MFTQYHSWAGGCVFTTGRNGGKSIGSYSSNNLSHYVGDDSLCVHENVSQLAGILNISPECIIVPFQNHGESYRIIDNNFISQSKLQQATFLNGVDALITNLPGVCVAVTTADCVPVLLVDEQLGVVASVHAGWRGTCARIAVKTLVAMQSHFGTMPINVKAYIGPSISVNVYEVGSDVLEQFNEAAFRIEDIFQFRNQKCFLDLWKANQTQLFDAGILSENIHIDGNCTFTQHRCYFSARKLGIKSGRMLSGVMIGL